MVKSNFDFDFVYKVLARFNRFRRDIIKINEDYCSRLVQLLPSTTKQPQAQPESAAKSGSLLKPLQPITSIFKLLARFMVRLPWNVRQVFKVYRLGVGHEKSNNLWLISASNRIRLNSATTPAREYLTKLMAPLPTAAEDLSLDKLLIADNIILYDPLFFSDYWASRKKLWREQIFVFDGAFLALFLCLYVPANLLLRFRVTCANLRRAFRCSFSEKQQSGFKKKMKNFLSLLFMLPCQQTNQSVTDVSALFFTCNSLLTELVRAYFIQEKKCSKIYEVMHGIGSVPVSDYFDSIVQLADAANYPTDEKLFFIPQIEGLPFDGVIKRQVVAANQYAINTYLNQNFLNLKSGGDDCYYLLKEKCRQVFSESKVGAQLRVLTIFGARPLNDDFASSPTWRIEKFLIEKLHENCAEQNLILLYVPHPSCQFGESQIAVFDGMGLRIVRDSIFAWLVSDFSISLVSSASFESSYFGAQAFMPILESDAIFSQRYLAMLSVPDEDGVGALVAGFNRFCQLIKAAAASDIDAKLRARLEKMVKY